MVDIDKALAALTSHSQNLLLDILPDVKRGTLSQASEQKLPDLNIDEIWGIELSDKLIRDVCLHRQFPLVLARCLLSYTLKRGSQYELAEGEFALLKGLSEIYCRYTLSTCADRVNDIPNPNQQTFTVRPCSCHQDAFEISDGLSSIIDINSHFNAEHLHFLSFLLLPHVHRSTVDDNSTHCDINGDIKRISVISSTFFCLVQEYLTLFGVPRSGLKVQDALKSGTAKQDQNLDSEQNEQTDYRNSTSKSEQSATHCPQPLRTSPQSSPLVFVIASTTSDEGNTHQEDNETFRIVDGDLVEKRDYLSGQKKWVTSSICPEDHHFLHSNVSTDLNQIMEDIKTYKIWAPITRQFATQIALSLKWLFDNSFCEHLNIYISQAMLIIPICLRLWEATDPTLEKISLFLLNKLISISLPQHINQLKEPLILALQGHFPILSQSEDLALLRLYFSTYWKVHLNISEHMKCFFNSSVFRGLDFIFSKIKLNIIHDPKRLAIFIEESYAFMTCSAYLLTFYLQQWMESLAKGLESNDATLASVSSRTVDSILKILPTPIVKRRKPELLKHMGIYCKHHGFDQAAQSILKALDANLDMINSHIVTASQVD